MNIVPFESSYQQQCEAVITSLPTWFGIPGSNASYMRNLSLMPTWVALEGSGEDEVVIGTVTLEPHFHNAYEVHYIAVRVDHHRRGIGRALLEHAESAARAEGGVWIHVKTLGPSHPDEGYKLTRAFYEAMGYAPLFETDELWEGNPALIAVKQL